MLGQQCAGLNDGKWRRYAQIPAPRLSIGLVQVARVLHCSIPKVGVQLGVDQPSAESGLMLAEIHLPACGYGAQCADLGECTERATVLARWRGHQSELPKQLELRERHAQWVEGVDHRVRDLRE